MTVDIYISFTGIPQENIAVISLYSNPTDLTARFPFNGVCLQLDVCLQTWCIMTQVVSVSVVLCFPWQYRQTYYKVSPWCQEKNFHMWKRYFPVGHYSWKLQISTIHEKHLLWSIYLLTQWPRNVKFDEIKSFTNENGSICHSNLCDMLKRARALNFHPVLYTLPSLCSAMNFFARICPLSLFPAVLLLHSAVS